MFRLIKALVKARVFAAAAALVCVFAAAVFARADGETMRYGFGRAATPADIAAWDIDVRYDGAGLPAGGGDVAAGEALYDAQCAVCHGDFGQGEGRWPALAGGFESLKNQGGAHRPEKTVGSYWPYAPVLYDYVRRAMPYNNPQSLSDDETYALVAYLLHLNGLADADFVADAASLAAFVMPNRDNFFIDDRPDVAAAACMKDCLDAETSALVEAIKGVTPTAHLPAAAAAAGAAGDAPAAESRAAAQYQQFCALCHDSGIGGAPLKNNTDEWRRRKDVAGGMEMLIKSAIAGKGAMPPKGGALHLSDEEIAAIVLLLAQEARGENS